MKHFASAVLVHFVLKTSEKKSRKFTKLGLYQVFMYSFLCQTVLICLIHILFIKRINTFWSKRKTRKVVKIHKTFWVYQVFVYNILYENVPISHMVYYYHALKAYLTLLSKNCFFSFFLFSDNQKFHYLLGSLAIGYWH